MDVITNEMFEERMLNKYGDEYKVIGDYINMRTNVKVKHIKCGKELDIKPHDFLRERSKGCNHCRIKSQTKDTEWFKNKVKQKCGNGYVVLSEYLKAKEKITMKHNECGYIWDTTPDNFLRRNSRCPNCSGNARTNTKLFKERLNEVVGNEYTMLGEYVNARTKVLFRHNICSHEWYVRPELFTRGDYGCPKCKISLGESKVKLILDKYNKKYEREVRFDECRNINPLPFDFVLYNTRNKIIGIIEYDGIQHFKPIQFFGGEDRLKDYRVRDEIKNNYCKTNRIPLLRIPYTLDDIGIERKLLNFFSIVEK